MATIKLITPSILDIYEIIDFKNKHLESLKKEIPFDIWNIIDYKDWLDSIIDLKYQIKHFKNIFHFYLIKSIENNNLIGFLTIKHSIKNESDFYDVNINFYLDKKFKNKNYESQIINHSIYESKKHGLDELIVNVNKNDISTNRVCLDHMAKLKRQIIDTNHEIINKYLIDLKIIN